MSNALDLNRAFLFGDGFFETMRILDDDIPLWEYHMERAQRTALVLETHWPKDLDIILLKRHVLAQNANNLEVVRLDFFRTGSGTYLPQSNDLEYVFSFRALPNEASSFALNASMFEESVTILNPIQVGIYHNILKPCNALSNLKSSSALFYVKAALFLKGQKNLEDLLILNQHGRICEGLASNIIYKRNLKWYGVKQEEGPVLGVFQRHLSSFLDIELTAIEIRDLYEADIILLTNAAIGIRRVELVR